MFVISAKGAHSYLQPGQRPREAMRAKSAALKARFIEMS
jgi:hypothetical protein